MAEDPNPVLYNSDDDEIITAINFGTGDAGGYKPDADGTEYHVWNDKGAVLGSSKMTSVKVTVRDSDGQELEPLTYQHWVEIKSTTIEEGEDGGDASGETDDNMADFQPVGKDAYLSLGDIPSDCYRIIFVRVNLPTSAIEAGVTFSIVVTNQDPSSSIAKWLTGIHGHGVIPSGNMLEVTDNAGADSKIDIASGYALINDIEVYLPASQTYTISTTDATYKIYLTRTGVISSTTGAIPSNSLQIAEVVISSNVVSTVTDKRVFIGNVRAGLDAAKTTTPHIGMVYIATDTNITYVCYVAETWTTIGIKNNMTAEADPSRTDDSSEGYSVGSQWQNTYNSIIWECVDNTEDAAVWTIISKWQGGHNISAATAQLTSNNIGYNCLKPTAAQTITLPVMYDGAASDVNVFGDQEGIRIILEVGTNVGDNTITVKVHDDDYNDGDICIGYYGDGVQTYTKLRNPGDRVVLEWSYYWQWQIVYEHIRKVEVLHLQDLRAADVDYIHAAIAGNGASQDISTAITHPDYSRVATITTTNVDTPSGNVTITGLYRGISTTDIIAIVAGGTATGVIPFDTITNINIPDGVSASDTVTVGIGDIIGLPKEITAVGDVYKKKVNKTDATAELSGKINATYGTVDLATIVENEETTLWYLAY